MSLLSRFFGTSLPDMRPQHLSARGKHQVSAGVVSQKLDATLQVDLAVSRCADK